MPNGARASSPLRRWALAAAQMQMGSGGISAVARLTAKVLADSGEHLATVTLLDDRPPSVGEARALSAAGSRLRFGVGLITESLRSSYLVYDSIGTARAHRFVLPRRPYAVWMHGIEVWRPLQGGRREALRGANLRIVNSEYTRERTAAVNSGIAGTVCWLGTESDDLPTSLPSFRGPPSVLIVSRIEKSEWYKGHAELIQAWPTVLRAVPDAKLVIAGTGSALDALRALVGVSSARKNIEITGYVTEARLRELWLSSQVFAMPSRNEGFGLVYAEAMRYGLPVISSIHDAGAEVNVDGDTGFCVDLDRPGDLSERLIQLLRDPDLARLMGRRGQLRWEQYFKYSAFRARLAPLLGAAPAPYRAPAGGREPGPSRGSS